MREERSLGKAFALSLRSPLQISEFYCFIAGVLNLVFCLSRKTTSTENVRWSSLRMP